MTKETKNTVVAENYSRELERVCYGITSDSKGGNDWQPY